MLGPVCRGELLQRNRYTKSVSAQCIVDKCVLSAALAWTVNGTGCEHVALDSSWILSPTSPRPPSSVSAFASRRSAVVLALEWWAAQYSAVCPSCRDHRATWWNGWVHVDMLKLFTSEIDIRSQDIHNIRATMKLDDWTQPLDVEVYTAGPMYDYSHAPSIPQFHSSHVGLQSRSFYVCTPGWVLH